ncbi:hypothetical protein [Planktothrix sp. FACHB-1365]|uniref:hypothetical protein n=1 Tax=Planktothrix sp. FACHB-1365 TaxID=2692855 RepID=UPI0016894F67|nr:hypothetical protein [Planktothrix sp. FACHB-1365]MBD2483969.1 hypothetical protein [Planktothrix sp. FACHB-1365]
MPTQKRRVNADIDDIYDLIEQMADEGRRSKGAQIRLLVDEALVTRGLIEPRPGVKIPLRSSEADRDNLKFIAVLVTKLIEGETPTDDEIRVCANLLDINIEKLINFCNLVTHLKK